MTSMQRSLFSCALVLTALAGTVGAIPACSQCGSLGPASGTGGGSDGSVVPTGVPRPKNVVILLVDTLRFDAMEKAAMPTFAGVARRSLVVDRAWAASTWTVPSVISLFTGSFPRTHGWDYPVGRLEGAPVPAVPLLAEVLSEAGFRTDALHNNSYLAMELGFNRGFETWKHTSDARMATEVGRVLQAWQADEASPETAGRRHFLYLHLIGTHSGLNPSPEARARWNLDDAWFEDRLGLLIGRAKRGTEPGVRDAYRAAYYAVAEDTDARVGKILETLAPVLPESLLILLADHGEELGETGVFEHGWSVAETLTHVPLMISGPGVKPEHRPTASLAELADLITDSLGLQHAWPVQSPWSGPLASERHGKLGILADGRWKGAWFGSQLTLYDLQQDPTGLQTTTEGADQVHAARAAWTTAVPAGTPSSARVELDPKTVEAIRALGYLD